MGTGTGNKGLFNSKTIIAIVLGTVGLALLIVGITGFFNSGKRKPAEARESIVWVLASASDTSGASAAGSGTGWAVGTPGSPVQYYVTNGHVVQMAYEYPREYANISGEIRIYYSYADNDYVVPEVVYYSGPSEKDIAILKIPTPTTKRKALTLRPSSSVELGETAYALGFPGDSSDRSSYNTYDQDDITITRGVISKKTGVTWASYDTFQMDVKIAGGNSGGPLVDKDGFAIGINVAAATDMITGADLDMYYAITADELIKVLKAEDISFSSKGYKAWMTFTFIPAGILMLGAGAALFFIELNRFKKSQNVFAQQAMPYGQPGAFRPSPQAAPVFGQPPQQGFVQPQPLQPQPVQPQPVQPQPVQPQPVQPQPVQPQAAFTPSPTVAINTGTFSEKPVLIGLEGKYAGERFDIKGSLIIGRNPAVCKVLFEDKTPGISGNHCEITYDTMTDSFSLMDNGSSYGTFLEDGKKLEAKIPEKLKAGDIFYLADGTNKFQVNKE